MSSKSSPRQKPQLQSAPNEPRAITLAELRAALDSIAVIAVTAAAHLSSHSMGPAPVMLTSTQFAERYGDVTPETVERWCRDGEFPLAINRKKGGWRIPEFYLIRNDPPPELRGWFARNHGEESLDEADVESVTASGDAQGDTPSGNASAGENTGERADAAPKDDLDDYLEFLTDAEDAGEPPRRPDTAYATGSKPSAGPRRRKRRKKPTRP